MISFGLYRKIQVFLIGAFVVLLPNSPDHIKLGSLLLFISSLLLVVSIPTLMKQQLRWNAGAVILIAWFLLKLLGCIQVENLELGFRAVFLKIPFLLLPLILLSLSLSRKEIFDQLKLFILGAVIASLTAILYGLFRTFYFGSFEYMVYSELSPFLDPSYLGLYLNFAFYLVVYRLQKEDFNRKLWLFYLVVFSLTIILLLSRNAMIILGLNLFYLSYVLLKKRQWALFLSKYALLFSIAFIVLQNERVVLRVKSAVNYFDSESTAQNERSFNTRIEVWKNTVELISENKLIGVGTGVEREELAELYERDGFQKAKESGYNTHNQLLQTVLAHGAFGALLILLVFVVPFLSKTQILQAEFLLPFLIICFVSFFTESILERQAGVFFFACFYSLLTLKPND